METVSVIVACFNQRQYIEQCIDSILSQTYPDIEAIVVDDGSIDGTRDYLKTAAARYRQIKVAFNERNPGAATVRAKGIGLSSGSLLTTSSTCAAKRPFVCR
jgi:glycosyltransferase involved in cell wall biosynthesis